MLHHRKLLCLLVLIGACGEGASRSDGPSKEPAAGSAPVEEKKAPLAPEPDFSGEITGIVKLAPGAQLPLAKLEDAVRFKLVVAPGCPPITDADRQVMAQNSSTFGLSPVHVAITQMSAAPKREAQTHDVAIENCRLKPALLGAMKGDKVRVTNKSPAPLLPMFASDPYMQALLQGTSREVPLEAIGPMALHCGFGGFCGESWILAVGHSLYAVTDAEGHFKISGIPLDEELVVNAWHPLFDVTSQPFKLTKADRSKVIELELKPLPAAPEPASPIPAAGSQKSKAPAGSKGPKKP